MSITHDELERAAAKAFADHERTLDPRHSWSLIADMGWLALCVPEERGGLGQGLQARAIIHRALGRALVPGPVIAQMMAIDALAQAESNQATDILLDAAMAGEKIAASLGSDPGAPVLSAVIDADCATHVLHLVDERVAIVPMETCGSIRRESWDETRRVFDVTVPAGAGVPLAEGEAARVLTATVRANALIALAADALGGAEAALAMAVEHLGTRQQFGRPLAMFQALKHRCADLRVNIALAEALLRHEADKAQSLFRAGALKAMACRTFKDVAEEAIQLHGGIGLTAEHSCHLFLKRALLNAALGGDADYWEERAGRDRLAEYALP